MKYNTSKHVVSILLILVMIVGILPITAFAEEVYTKLGEIPTVTVNAELNPTVGGKNKLFDLIEITSPVDQGVSVSGYWQKWNEEKQKWEQYGMVPHPTMEEGTYRMYVQLRTESNDANEYYALTANTSLYVNDVKWTKDPDYSVLSYSKGYGYIYFYSPEFVLTKDGENSGGNLTGLKLKTSPSKTEYIEGEYFDTTGMEVYACYDNSETIIVKDYFVVNGLSLVEEQNSVTISYTKGTETVKLDVPITVGDELEDEKVFEVYSWSDFEAAFYYSDNRGESYTIKLMKSLTYMAEDAKRSATALVEVQVLGCNVTLDFNGYTLKCYDNVSTTDLTSSLSDFIRIGLRSRYGTPIELRLTDSKGGGGIYMESDRAYDNQLAALHIVDMRCYVIDGIYQTCESCNKLTIDGGNYRLSATTQKIGPGTINPNVFYRGTVIADTFAQGAIVINGGKFEAKSNGRYYDGDDFCARELSAFATCSNATANICGVEEAHTIINGGMFISDGYAIHHFDHSLDTDETRSMRFPKIYGGVFLGSIGYIGMSFTYDNWDCSGLGMDEYKERAASTIVNPSTLFVYIKGGKMLKQTDGLTLMDLHEADSVYVINESLLKLKTVPVTNGFKALERYVGQTETFKLDYTVPYGLDEFIYTPYISVTPNGGATTTENVTEKTIDYKDYPNGLDVVVGLKVKIPATNEEHYFMSIYSIDVSEVPAAPVILAQPYSMTVGVGECAEAMVVANNAASYQWYYLYDGSSPIKLTDSFVSAMGGGITGYTSPRLSVTLDGVGREYFQCYVTGTDGSTVKTNKISFTYGTMPSEKSFGGGEIRANGDAEFKLWAKYADVIKWVVVKHIGGSKEIYTLEKFAEETGCEYGTTHRDYATGLHSASVLFKNVDESWAGKYYIGYTLENSLGKVELDLNNLLPFEAYVNRPVIKKFIEEQSCFIGEDMTFSFEADNMTSAEWYFEKADEDGIMIVYTLDELRTLFPNTTFETAFYGDEATMTISNADLGLCEYVICPTAVNSTAAASAGTSQIYVMTSADDADPIKISKQPTNVYVANGEKAETTVIATGEGLTYTWYYTLDKNGVEFYKSSVTGATYSTTMNTARTGRKVYCVITDKYGNSVTTDTAVLSLPSSIMIISQPKSASASNGSKITTTVAATGDGLTYTWYFTSNKAGVEFFVSSVTSATYSTTMDETRDGRKVYCVITDKYGNSVTTDTVTLSMASSLAITKQPTNVSVAKGEKAETTVEATGEDLTYTWYYTSNKAGVEFFVSSVTGATYTTVMDETRDGRKVYCVITDKYGNTVTTDTVTLSMASSLAITKQPTNVSVAKGEKAETTVEATGEGLTYTWYYTSNKAGVEFFVSSVTGATYTTVMDETRDGRKVYCVITDKNGNTVTTNTVTLTMKSSSAIKIAVQPKSVSASNGTKITTTVTATGEGLKYTWYYTSNGKTNQFFVSSVTSATYSTTMDATRDGRKVYCVITDKYGNSVTTDTVTLSMGSGITITKQPTNVYVANGEKAETTVTATGEGLTYTWYYTLDKNGVEFYVSSVTSATYSTTMNTARTGRKVYCVITDKYGNSVTTDTVVLSLPSAIMITSQPKSASASNGSKITTTVTATGEELTYTWYYTSNGKTSQFYVSSVTSATYSTTMDATRDGRKVYCVITDKNGNTVTTNTVTLTMK